MPTATFSGEIALRSRRFSHLAVLRLLLALAYLLVEARIDLGAGVVKVSVAGLFVLYAALILGYRSRAQVRNLALAIQFVDLILAVVLVAVSAAGGVAFPLLFFYFLLTESVLLHGAREVLAVTTLSLFFYTAWITGGPTTTFRFSYGSFAFLLVVGAAMVYYFSDQIHRTERRIASILREAAGESEAEMVRAVEAALEQLADWRNCSRAILAFWDKGLEYDAVCQYPPTRPSTEDPPERFEAGREWACLRSERLDFYADSVTMVGRDAKPATREFHVHPYLIQKFEVYNALSCGLFDGEQAIGRLLLINSVSQVRRADWKRLRNVAPYFREVVRHLLVVKKTEHEAYERERGRIAQDLHDGPLQSIISFEMRLEIIRKLLQRDVRSGTLDLESLQQFSRNLVTEMRAFVHRARPLESTDASLVASARRLVEGFQRESGVSVTVAGGENGDFNLPGKLSAEILQVLREALHNIYKHAEATHVVLTFEKRGADLRIGVDDNGQGFFFGGSYSLEELDLLRIGPRSIKQRVRALGGDLTLESNPGHGSNMRVAIPLY